MLSTLEPELCTQMSVCLLYNITVSPFAPQNKQAFSTLEVVITDLRPGDPGGRHGMAGGYMLATFLFIGVSTLHVYE